PPGRASLIYAAIATNLDALKEDRANSWGRRLSVATSHDELNALQNELRNHGLVVLGFPCNQFGKQEPGTNAEILPGLRYVRPGGGFVPNFQLFQKGDVNGDKEQRIYTFLKNSCPPPLESFGDPKRLFWEPLKVHDIKWNFEKFLVGPDGKPVMRWAHRTNIGTVKSDILKYMREQQNLSMG
uniref:Glutathione peroxidase n=1 Tax=Podarcis muralis TaxID=64176 RepID=A0A670IGJ0_PODMU